MKPLTPWILCSALVLPALADENPDEKTPPPAVEVPQAEEKPAAPAFLGVGTNVVPEILLEHLDLKPGEGVMIESMQEDSPATKAGIKVGDIITRVAGKPVVSTLDLGEKIRAHKPGESLKIDVIQKGKPATLEVTLAERPADLMDPAIFGQFGNPAAGNLLGRVNDLQRRVQAMQLQMGNLAPGNPMFGGGINVNGGEFRFGDKEGTVGYKGDGDGTEVTVRDLNDKIVWSGPWDTEQDKAAAPEDIRRRIERFNIQKNQLGHGFKLQMGADQGFVLPPDPQDPLNPMPDGEDEEEP